MTRGKFFLSGYLNCMTWDDISARITYDTVTWDHIKATTTKVV
jgi:hypothetical protein